MPAPNVTIERLDGFVRLLVNGKSFAEVIENHGEKPILWISSDAPEVLKSIQYSAYLSDVKKIIEGK